MTDAERTPDPARALRQLTPGTVVIFRHYEAPDRAALGQRLATLARRLGLVFIVAGDRRLAHRLRAGVDLILLSPVFPTTSHPGRPALGVRRLAALCRGTAVPVLALGGVTPATLSRVRAARAAGVAGIGALPHLCRDPFGLRAASLRNARSRRLAHDRDMV